MKTIELSPVDGHKSFYGKAKIEEEGQFLYLRSYDSIVAIYNTQTNSLTIRGWWSMTTQRHLNSFLSYIGRPTMTKQEIVDAVELPF